MLSLFIYARFIENTSIVNTVHFRQTSAQFHLCGYSNAFCRFQAAHCKWCELKEIACISQVDWLTPHPLLHTSRIQRQNYKRLGLEFIIRCHIFIRRHILRCEIRVVRCTSIQKYVLDRKAFKLQKLLQLKIFHYTGTNFIVQVIYHSHWNWCTHEISSHQRFFRSCTHQKNYQFSLFST